MARIEEDDERGEWRRVSDKELKQRRAMMCCFLRLGVSVVYKTSLGFHFPDKPHPSTVPFFSLLAVIDLIPSGIMIKGFN